MKNLSQQTTNRHRGKGTPKTCNFKEKGKKEGAGAAKERQGAALLSIQSRMGGKSTRRREGKMRARLLTGRGKPARV